MATKKKLKTKSGKVGTYYGKSSEKTSTRSIDGNDVQYRTVIGKNSGEEHQVRLGSAADANYDSSGMFQGKDADKQKFSTVNKPKKEVGMISSQTGKNIVQGADQKIADLSPITADVSTPQSQQSTATSPTVTTPTTPEPTKETPTDTVTYVNEQTGQEQTFRGSAITEENKKNLETQGYTLASSDVSTIPESPEITKLQNEVDIASKETSSFMSRLESMLISDKELRGEIKQINTKYKAREEEMRGINERRKIAMNTLGSRLGARYIGGTGGIFGSILSEEERQGLDRIEKYENDKQDAILNAKKAARQQNYQLYATLAQRAEKIQEQKAAELQTLKKAQAEQNARIEKERKKIVSDTSIAELMRSGVTDPLDVYTQMALDGSLGDTKLSDIIAIASSMDNISYLNPKSSSSSEFSDIPEGGYDITQGFNFGKAKAKDYRALANKLFPSDFGNKLIVELSDEELEEFIKDYSSDVNAQQMNIEPEEYYLNWVEKSGAVENKKSSFEEKLEALKSSFE